MIDKQEISKRLNLFLEYKKLSISKVETLTTIGRNSLNNAINGTGGIGVDKIANILSYFSELNCEWLLLGKGKMIKESEIEESQDQYITNNVIDKVYQEKVKGLEMMIEKQNEEIKFLRSLLKKD